MNRTRLTKTFIAVMVLDAIAGGTYVSLGSHTLHLSYALALLALAAVTSRMKVKLPGIEGNMSVNLPFLLMAVVSLSAVEAILIAGLSTLVQCWPKRGGKFKTQQVVFNVSMMAFAASLANLIWNAGWFAKASWPSEPLMLALTTAAFFFGQTAPVATVINLAEGAPLRRTWLNIAQMSFPYFVLSAGVTSMMSVVSHRFGWQAALVVFPVMYGVHHSYRMYFGKLMQTLQAPAMAKTAGAGM
ncbi:MAG: hypothetical protein WA252_06835 [Candidatus Sulfotelmatobacter sp.]